MSRPATTSDVNKPDHPKEESTEQNEEYRKKVTPDPESGPPKDEITKLREAIVNGNFDIGDLKKYKKTDYRRDLLLSQLKELKRFSRLSKKSVSVQYGPQPKSSSVSIDTSRAGSNIDVVRLCIQKMKWREYNSGKPNGHCDVYWNAVSFHEDAHNIPCVINKFPGMNELLHKVNLTRTLEIMRTLFVKEYDFYPLTWYLPHQLPEFTAYHRENKSSKPIFIVKPDLGCQGDGIYLIKDPQDYVVSSRNHVVQEYIQAPLLVDGFKFDLRIYVVLLSIEPLQIHICKEGLARLCTVIYQKPTVRNLNDTFMHLTNYSLNKYSKNFVHTDTEDDGSKRTMSSVFFRLESMGIDVGKIWANIESLVCKTVIAFLPELKVHIHAQETQNPKGGPKCFQILGFDAIILENMKVMLLEVNSAPSLRLDYETEIVPGIQEYFISPVDIQIKKPLIMDTLKMVKKFIKPKFNRATTMVNERPKKQASLSVDFDDEGRSRNGNDLDNDGDDETDSKENDNSSTVSSKTVRFPNHQQPSSAKSSALLDHTQRQAIMKHRRASREEAIPLIADGEDPPPSIHRRLNVGRQTSRKEPALETFRNGDVSYVVSGTSPNIRNRASHARLMRRREKSWLKKEKSKGDDEVSSVVDSDGGQSSMWQRKRHEDFDDESEESCLEEIYPAKWGAEFERLRVLEQMMEIFLTAIGIRANFRMGPTAFRTFARKCHLNQLGFTLATVDIMYIDLQRRWEYLNADGNTGLCFQAFVEAFFKIALQKYRHEDKPTAIAMMIQHCQQHMGLGSSLKSSNSTEGLPRKSTTLSNNAYNREYSKLQDYLQQKTARTVYFYSPTRAVTFHNSLLPNLADSK